MKWKVALDKDGINQQHVYHALSLEFGSDSTNRQS